MLNMVSEGEVEALHKAFFKEETTDTVLPQLEIHAGASSNSIYATYQTEHNVAFYSIGKLKLNYRLMQQYLAIPSTPQTRHDRT